MINSRIKLLLTDIDGCLIAGEQAPYDCEALAAIRELNRAATPHNAIPYITICSGRPYPYVEAMIKLVTASCLAFSSTAAGSIFRNASYATGASIIPPRCAPDRCANAGRSWQRASRRRRGRAGNAPKARL